MTQFINSSMRYIIATFLLITTFAMTLFILSVTTMLACVVALKVGWQKVKAEKTKGDQHTKTTIIDAEYTVVEK